MIEAIETQYKGYRFRSRLEARWAVFFDALGLSWEYEPEGFDLGEHGWYLPDFRVWTPQGRPVWYEVKPKPGHEQKFLAFARLLDNEVRTYEDGVWTQNRNADRHLLLVGDPHSRVCETESGAPNLCPRCGVVGTWDVDFRGCGMVGYLCDDCDWETPPFDGNTPEVGVGVTCEPYKGWLLVNSEQFFPFVWDAAKKARSARFEHGECPA